MDQQQQIQGELAVAILDFLILQRVRKYGRRLAEFAKKADLDERQLKNLVKASVLKAMNDF